ncbi:MAG TPA: DUF2530 domain-containing protein [Frankiaceae bacterium]|nr:DUF2530 domain-containing protein [Frankiaceae bacterium]
MERKPDPEPLRTNDVRAVQLGTALWAVAVVVFAVLREWDGVWTCVAGLALGFVGIVYTKRRAAAIARDEAAGPNGPSGGGS